MRHLDRHRDRLESTDTADSAREHPGGAEAEQGREDVEHVPVTGAQRAHHPVGQAYADLFEEKPEVPGHTDGDDGRHRDVFEQQVPADEPADDLAERHVTVGVGRSGLGDHSGELGVTQCGRGTGDTRDQEGDQHGRTGDGMRDRLSIDIAGLRFPVG
ncbi:hypothetical protein JOJ86_000722 [Rhodococcus percolatus]|nr:hypothetical protein [Rhodococcus opacus]